MAMRDPYEVLGVPRDADEETVTAAYRALAKQYHPDLHPGDKAAAAKMREINEAYTEIREHDAAFGGDADAAAESDFAANGGGDAQGFWREFGHRPGTPDVFAGVRAALARDEFARALTLLDGISAKDAYWYYFAACAHRGRANPVLALHYAKTAHELDPYEPVFEELYDGLRGEITEDREKAARRAAAFDTCKRVILLVMALCMVGGVLFQACMK